MLVTILIVFVIAAFVANRGLGLSILLASMLIWPEYARFDLGITKMSVTRFVAIILLFKWKTTSNLEINRYDRIVFFYWFYSVLMMIIAGSNFAELTRTIGRCLDTVLMYYAARVCLVSKRDFESFNNGLKFSIVPASFLALQEMISASSLYVKMRYANEWVWLLLDYEARLGTLVRAYGTTLQPIYWGMTMASTNMIFAITSAVSGKKLFSFVFVIGLVGVFTSLSSGPIGMMFLFLGMTVFIKNKAVLKRFLWTFLFMAIVVEIISNRHFYDLVQYLSLNGQTAWYRSKLIDVATRHLSEYILIGVGAHWPHHWGAQIDGRAIVDVVNQYIIVCLYGGIGLLIMFIYLLFKPVTVFVKGWIESTPIPNARKLYMFSIMSIFFAGFSVGFFNPFEIILYLLLGIGRQLQVLDDKSRSFTGNAS